MKTVSVLMTMVDGKKQKKKKQQVFLQKGRLLFLTFFHHLGGFETNPRVIFSIACFLCHFSY